MATPTLAELLAPRTRDQVKTDLLAALQSAGFPVSDWNSGGVARTLVELFALVVAQLYVVLVAITGGGFVTIASGGWLSLVASEVYQLTRNPAAFASGTVRLTCPAASGPFTIAAGQLRFVSASGRRFTNTAGGTLTSGGTLDLAIKAESPGSAYNVPAGTITTMLTPLPGVTCTNPLRLSTVAHAGSGGGTVTPSGTPSVSALVVVKVVTAGVTGVAAFQRSLDGGASWGATTTTGGAVVLAGTGITLAFAGTFVLGDTYTFSTSWISTPGTDEEADEALRARCKARWPSLGVAPTVDVYDLWARTASPTITKTRAVPSPTIPGQVDLYLATAAGVTPGADVTAVADYVAAREPLTMTSNVQSASVGAIAVQATLYVENGRQGTAAVESEAALEALVAGLDIGGTLYLSELLAALTGPAGVRNVVVALPAADVVLVAGQVGVLSPAPVLTVVPV
jgi:uncharacterized phage protein gp47/JayE